MSTLFTKSRTLSIDTHTFWDCESILNIAGDDYSRDCGSAYKAIRNQIDSNRKMQQKCRRARETCEQQLKKAEKCMLKESSRQKRNDTLVCTRRG